MSGMKPHLLQALAIVGAIGVGAPGKAATDPTCPKCRQPMLPLRRYDGKNDYVCHCDPKTVHEAEEIK